MSNVELISKSTAACKYIQAAGGEVWLQWCQLQLAGWAVMAWSWLWVAPRCTGCVCPGKAWSTHSAKRAGGHLCCRPAGLDKGCSLHSRQAAQITSRKITQIPSFFRMGCDTEELQCLFSGRIMRLETQKNEIHFFMILIILCPFS